MIKLTAYEKEMQDGKYGDLKKKAISKVIEYANALGAKELCEVTKAHLFCGAHLYLDSYKPDNPDDIEEILSEMHFCSKEKLKFEKFVCYCQSDCGPMDPDEYEYLGISKERGERNKKFLEFYKGLGVALAGTCVPYMTGFIPMMGEHYVSSESHAVTMMNALFGACGNSDGLEAGFWSAVCGRTPKWGNHIMENRKGTHLFEVIPSVETAYDWDVLGYAIGMKLPPHSIPVIEGSLLKPDIFKLKYFFAAMATTAGPEMCHIVGFTPEAPTKEAAFGTADMSYIKCVKITQADLDNAISILSDTKNAKLDVVSLGCPHYSIDELREIAEYLDGKTVSKNTQCNIWTALSIKDIADRNGYTAIIEKAGAKVLTSSCPLTSDVFPKEYGKNILFDSAKQAHYIRPLTKAGIYYRPLKECLYSAVTGRIER